MIDRLLIGMLTGGHVLLEGVPGLAKTLTVSSLAECLDVSFHRIQFTPDLLPADVVGTMIYNQETGEFTAKRGPIFAQVVLADEINRAPPKVQSALLEAMQEKQVTIGGETFPLAEPFLVLATQNPIEQEGTYPLPEAQVDRFMLKLRVTYPDRATEKEIMRRMAGRAPEPWTGSPRPRRSWPPAARSPRSTWTTRSPTTSWSWSTRPGTGGARPCRYRAPHRVRCLPPRVHLPGDLRPCPRVPGRPRVRATGGREGHRPRRAAPPHPHDLRGRGGGGHLRRPGGRIFEAVEVP
jgi:hypothetical protein